MLLLPEEQLPACSKAIRAEATGTGLVAEIEDVIAAILVSRFSGRTVPELCAMGGITAYDFTSSVAYREIFGLALQESREEGRQTEAVALTLRQLSHRCGALTPSKRGRSQALSLRALDRYCSWHEPTAKQALGRISKSTLNRDLTSHLQKL